MIQIQESEPLKISGETSLRVTFPFNPAVIDVLKGCSSFHYHKQERCWEVPTTSLAYLLDTLVTLDSIDLVLKGDAVEEETLQPSLTYKIPPFPYQQEGIR